jgi:glycosyltransferase involved in cell wall biosynthesis
MVGLMPVARAYAYSCATRRRRPDVWQTTNYNIPAWWRGATVVSVYDLTYCRYPQSFPAGARRRFIGQQKAAVKAADVVIANSATTKTDVVEHLGVPEDRVIVVYLASSPAFRVLPHDALEGASPRVAEATRRIRPYLLLVGGRAGYKNGAAVLQAYARWEGRKDVALVVAGPPLDAEERALIADIGPSAGVVALEDVDDEDLCVLYNRAAAFVYPSLWEGFGIPLLEAMSCACPVVASTAPSSVEVAGEAAFFFEAGDERGLIAALEAAVAADAGNHKIINGRERVREFSWQRCAQGHLDVYRRLVG